MNTAAANTIRRSAKADSAGASLFVASLDSASLPDMGDRSLDLETHAFMRPRRRAAAVVPSVIRRATFPFPEPRLPDLSVAAIGPLSNAAAKTAERELRQVEENAGLRFIRPVEVVSTPQASDSQVVVATAVSASVNDSVKRAIAAQAFVMGPPPRESTLVIQPPFDLNRSTTVVRRPEPVTRPQVAAPAPSPVPALTPAPKPFARFASIEDGIARMSERKCARIAVLAIGVSEGAIGKVGRLAEILRVSYSRNVEVLAAEHLDGLKMASSLVGEGAGQVSLVACQAGSPWQMLPFLGQFDGVILMVEIGETPVDEAAAWADAIRRNETPIVGVWAA